MKKILLNWIVRLFKGIQKWNAKFYQATVRSLYKAVRRKQDFVLATEEIRVKKGKIRYTIVMAETQKGKITLNIGRHLSAETLKQYHYR